MDKVAFNSECQVLQKNLQKLQEELSRNPELINNFHKGWAHSVKVGISERYDKKISRLNIYSEHTTHIKNVLLLSDDQTDIIVPVLETLAVSYLGLTHVKTLRPIIKDLHSKFVEMSKLIDESLTGVEDNLEDIEFYIGVFSSDTQKTDEYIQSFKSLITARDQIKTLPKFIGQSEFARASEFDKAARSTNLALYTWVKAIFAVWLNILGRTIVNSNDGKNGRKHLLEFLEISIAPLHQEIEYETLDNMLRKIQNEIKRDGELSLPNFKLGSSSPI